MASGTVTPIDEIRYCYWRDKEKRPMVTLCRALLGDTYLYGWAICSQRDAPAKKIGRAIAYQRALAATRMLHREESQRPARAWSRMVTRFEPIQMLVACHAQGLYQLIADDVTTALPGWMQPQNTGG